MIVITLSSTEGNPSSVHQQVYMVSYPGHMGDHVVIDKQKKKRKEHFKKETDQFKRFTLMKRKWVVLS